MKETQEIEIALLKQNQQTIMEKLVEFQESNREQHEDIRALLKSMEDKLDRALEKKANKWVETGFIWGLSCGGVVFIGLLVRWLVLVEFK